MKDSWQAPLPLLFFGPTSILLPGTCGSRDEGDEVREIVRGPTSWRASSAMPVYLDSMLEAMKIPEGSRQEETWSDKHFGK